MLFFDLVFIFAITQLLFLWAVTGRLPLTPVAGLSVTVALGAGVTGLTTGCAALMAAAAAVMFATR
jgi:hypothetical protein